MIVVNILLALVCVVLLIGIIGDKDSYRSRSYAVAFAAVIFLIAVLNR